MATALLFLVHSALSGQPEAASPSSHPSRALGQESAAPRPLAPGVTVERSIRAGHSQSYSMQVESGQFLHLAVVQRSVDVVLTLHGPDGVRRLEADFSEGPRGLETVSFIADAAGDFRLEVRADDPTIAQGEYAVTGATPRNPTTRDHDRAAAERLLAEGQRLSKEQNAESRRQAIERFAGARPLWRRLDDRFFEALCLFNEARTRTLLGENQDALDAFTEALSRWRTLGERAFEAKALNGLGVAHFYRTEHQKALDHFDQALPLHRLIGDRRGEAETLAYIGIAYGSLGRIQASLAVQAQALALRRGFGDRREEANVLHNMAVSYMHAGQMQQAIDLLHEALDLSRTAGDRRIEAAALGTLAYIYGALGEPRDALDHYGRALDIWRALGHRNGESATLEGLALQHLSLGETRLAVDYYDQVRDLHRAMRDESSSLTLVRMATAYKKLGDLNRASELLTEGLRPSPEGNLWTRARLLGSLGELYDEQGETEKAIDHHERALSLSRMTNDLAGEAFTLYELARIDLRLGAFPRARERLEAALKLIEATRNEVDSQELRASFAARAGGVHELYLDLLMRQHAGEPAAAFDARAFEASERSRVQSLLELLAESRLNLREGADPGLLERERSLRERLTHELERQMRLLARPHTEEQAAAATAEVQALRSEYRQLQGRLRVTSPRYAALRQPEILTVGEVQRTVLDADTLLLEYALGEERSFLFSVSQTSLRSYVLPGRADVEKAARRAYDLLSQPSERTASGDDRRARGVAAPDPELAKSLAAASRMLLGPAAGELGARRLLIAADGFLQYLPFAALPTPDRPDVALVREHEIVSVPSASLLAVLRAEAARRRPASKTLAVFADPVFDPHDERVRAIPGQQTIVALAPPAPSSDRGQQARRLTRAATDTGLEGAIPRLPFTRREAGAILALAPAATSRAALDFEASRKTVIGGDLADYRYVHFATHGFLNHAHPELSGLVLSLVGPDGAAQEGFLSAGDVFNLKLSADLVVLSGCRTALGKQVKGEGVLGLTRAFMYAGTPRVLASVWKVDDAATAELMARVYQGILADGLRPAAALRQAQLALAQQKRWQHPYYWAGFQLQGDWN